MMLAFKGCLLCANCVYTGSRFYLECWVTCGPAIDVFLHSVCSKSVASFRALGGVKARARVWFRRRVVSYFFVTESYLVLL